jgi:hypothetical protein
MGEDKKKIAILGILFVALLGVGAWQIMGTGKSEPKKRPEASKQTANEEAPVNNNYDLQDEFAMLSLERRDPFEPGALPKDPEQIARQQADTRHPANNSGGGTTSGSRIPTMIDKGTLPSPFGIQNNTTINPSEPIKNPNEFGYSLVGIVEGPRPTAVFKSESGKQVMADLNGSVGGQSKVVSIKNGKVTILHNGKKITMTTGGQK